MLEIKVPVFPESISEGTIATWHKKKGDSVDVDEIILEIETDKVVMEVPANEEGVIQEIHKQEGETVESAEVVGTMVEKGSESASEPQKDESEAKEPQDTAPADKKQTSGQKIDVQAPAYPESISEGTLATWHKEIGEEIEEGETLVEIETDKVMMEVPVAASGFLAEKLKSEGDTIYSEEVVARLTEGQPEAESSTSQTPASETESSESAETSGPDKSGELSPAARRAVKEHNLDPAQIKGTGKDGRITKQDVEAAAKKQSEAKSAQPEKTSQPASESTQPSQASQTGETSSDIVGERPEKRVKMTRLRQTIAKRLLEVQQTNAILSTFNEVDMKAVMDLRQKYKDLFLQTHDTKLGFMSFFLKASTEALKRFPEVNASIDGNDIVYHGFFDIGVAVGSDRGLVVPVIRNTDQLSFAQIESTIVEKANKARDGKLSIEEMQGGTFTVTNGGSYGSMLSTPIINSPQSAILGMHNIVDRPMAVNGEVVIRPVMYLALSYDHRIIDGSTSVKFLKTIKELIEDPQRLLLEI